MARVIAPPPGSSAVPVHVWSRDPPPAAVVQLERIAAQPYVVGHVAGMPDLHVAHGVAVGTVFATDGVVVPSALGGDLGCGVAAVRLDVPSHALGRQDLQRILAGWSARIPAGDAVHRGRGAADSSALPPQPLSTGSLEHARERLVRRHLGTLGGGNHFVELDRDMEGAVWLLVHSGSRGLGSAIGAHHLRAAEASGRGPVCCSESITAPRIAFRKDHARELQRAPPITVRSPTRRFSRKLESPRVPRRPFGGNPESEP